MARTTDGKHRLFQIDKEFADEPTMNYRVVTWDVPLPEMKAFLTLAGFTRLELVVETAKTVITAIDEGSEGYDHALDYMSEAPLRDAESGAAYERQMDAWAHSVESPEEARREAEALEDFEARLAAAPELEVRPPMMGDDEIPF